VSLEGEAGIGKSALTLAFVDACRGATRVHFGGCETWRRPSRWAPARHRRESQGRFLRLAVGQLATFEGLLRLLTGGQGPALLVLEDIHWADDATLDALRFLGRRIRAAPRAGAGHLPQRRAGLPERLASLWADMPRDARERIELAPLSMEAVAQLAARSGRLPGEVYARQRRQSVPRHRSTWRPAAPGSRARSRT
jgi:predicted ATPase